MTVVENNSEKEIRRAAWLFPVYLVLINLFVVPIAAAGLLSLPKGSFDADSFVLALPLSAGADAITLLAFVGGLSAATAMVIVDSRGAGDHGVATAWCCRCCCADARDEPKGQQKDMTGLLLPSAASPSSPSSCSAICSIACWARRTAWPPSASCRSRRSRSSRRPSSAAWSGATPPRAAPSAASSAASPCGPTRCCCPGSSRPAGSRARSCPTGPFGLSFLSPQALFYLQHRRRSRHGVLWSMAVNVAVFVTVSLLRAPEPVERLQAQVFVPGRPAAAAHVALVPALAHVRDGRRPAAHGGPLSGRRARRALVRRICRKPQRARSRPTRKPTSICCASPSICWPAPSAPHPRAWCCRCCCGAATPAASRPCACSMMRPRRCSTTAICCNRRSTRCAMGSAYSTRTCG